MIVYVESNFALELAYLQEEHESCSALLRLSESSDMRLALPAFSIGEPYEAWVRRSKQKKVLHEQLIRAIRELSRSKPYQESSVEFRGLTNLLIASGEDEKRRLDKTLEKILETVEIIPIGLSIIKDAIKLQDSLDLSPQDSIVYASIRDHLTKVSDEPRCFITRNSKDFANPDIENELKGYNCKLLTKFADGLRYVRNQL